MNHAVTRKRNNQMQSQQLFAVVIYCYRMDSESICASATDYVASINPKHRQRAAEALGNKFTKKNGVELEEVVYRSVVESSISNLDIESEYTMSIFQLLLEKEIDLKRCIPPFGWNHAVFRETKLRIKEQDDFLLNPFEVEEGVLECKCGSKRVFSYSKQVRSSDETMSTFASCNECSRQWVYSG
jgi:DNA-directed RNA polymerase subunit M/transcription elongation factor TFIIS